MCLPQNQHAEVQSQQNSLSKTRSERVQHEPPPQEFALCPPRVHMLLYFAIHFYILQKYNLWVHMTMFYAITWSLNPFSEWGDILKALRVSILKPQDVPFLYKLYGPIYIFWKVFYCYPVETCLWYLDDILFPGYQDTEIKEPLFLLGQPRSGTTMFESLLSEDEDRHCSMLLYEMRYPYLTVQYAVDFFSKIDKHFCKGRIYQFLKDNDMLSVLSETGERKNMRRLRYDLPDEDDLLFFFHTFCHFLLAGFFPREEMIEFNHRFCDLSHDARMRYMQLHRKAIQKVLFRRGQGKRYLAKWVAGWNGQLDMAKVVYPDAKYVVIVRDPKESLRSWMKLQGLLAYQLSGNNVMRNHREVREAIIRENVLWFQKEIEFCQTTPRANLLVLRYTDIVKDIPQQVKNMYRFLNQSIEKGSKFDTVLLNSKRKQIRHKKTLIKAEDEMIPVERIERDFPNVLKEIEFSRFDETEETK